MKKSNKEGYHSFLKELPKMKQNINTKEYYLRMRFYSAIDKNIGLLTELAEKKKEGDEETIVIEDRAEITEKVSEKYKILCRDYGTKTKYEGTSEGLLMIHKKDIEYALL